MDKTAQALNLEIQKLQQEIASNRLPPELLEKVNGMVEILKLSLQSGGSYSHLESVANYIDTVSKIPFNKETRIIWI